MRIGRGVGLGLAKDTRRHLTHHTGHQVAITLQAGEVEVTGLLQVHLAAADDGLQVLRLDAVIRHQRHQRLHHRVAGLASVSLDDFTLPPGQFGGGDVHLGGVVHHVVHLAAKRIKRGDGGAPGARQKEKGGIKAAAG